MPALLLNTTLSHTNPKLLSSRPSRHRCQASPSSTSTGGAGGNGNSSSSSSSTDGGGRARTGGRGSWVADYDLYELLGVERSSPHSEIKAAYRSLQKRCHPDVAGAGGHDMAIVLNEVYSLLSDPAQRLAYDQEQAKRSEFVGYTGRPLYSSWLGGEAEQRAVFVDEVRCVGCLKCALYASNTFAIESVYGRARVVAQWADAEDRIQDAIQTCPVDCISMVERSDLPALEFLMSKQPRGIVRVSEGNTSGARAPDIFAQVNKFKARFEKMKQKSATRESEESEVLRQSRTSAVHTIRSISNWWYWSPFRAAASPTASTSTPAPLRLLPPPRPSSRAADPVTERLQEAAARRKAEGTTAAVQSRRDDYWTPQLNLPSAANFSEPDAHKKQRAAAASRLRRAASGQTASSGVRKAVRIDLTVPLLMGIVAAGIVGYHGDEMAGGGRIEDHVGGAAALGVVNSFELRMVLAGVTWFVIGAAVASLIQVLGRRNEEEIRE